MQSQVGRVDWRGTFGFGLVFLDRRAAGWEWFG
jgi:hypothetical protein